MAPDIPDRIKTEWSRFSTYFQLERKYNALCKNFNKGQLLGFAMFSWGAGILTFCIVMVSGGLELMSKYGTPLTMWFLTPVNKKLQAWISVPIYMAMEGYLSNLRTTQEDGYIGVGQLDFLVKLSTESYTSKGISVVPVLFIQEDAEIDEVQRYVIRAGPYNHASIAFWVLAGMSLAGLVASLTFRFSRPETKKEKEIPMLEVTPSNVVDVPIVLS